MKLSKEAEKRIAECDAKQLCRFCKLPLQQDERVVRKCHPSCDKVIRRMIERGEITEVEAVADGIWGEAEAAGRKPRQPAV